MSDTLKTSPSAVRCGVTIVNPALLPKTKPSLGLCGEVAVRVEPWCDGKGGTKWMPVCVECHDVTLPSISVREWQERNAQ